MTILIVLSVVALWVLVGVQGLVLLEMVRQVSQIRTQLDLDDRPMAFSLGGFAGRPLPEPARGVWSENGVVRDGVLVFLSTDCATCRLVVSGLRDVMQRFEDKRVVAVLQARTHDEVEQMLAETGLTLDEFVVDLENEYGGIFGIDVRPAAVVVRDGIVSEGAVVRNSRQLHQLLERMEPPTREGVRPAESSVVSTPT